MDFSPFIRGHTKQITSHTLAISGIPSRNRATISFHKTSKELHGVREISSTQTKYEQNLFHVNSMGIHGKHKI